MIAAGHGLIQDVVITGHDNEFIGAIVFPELIIANDCWIEGSAHQVMVSHQAMSSTTSRVLNELAVKVQAVRR